MRLKFVKMEGLGNDFMVVEQAPGVTITPDRVMAWADRRTGIGFDSLLLIDRNGAPGRASYRVLNADGSEAEQCGNGARCIASFLTGGRPARLDLDSLGGVIPAEVLSDGRVQVNLGEPDFRPDALPFVTDEAGPDYALDVNGDALRIRVCSMGNPHAVLAVDSVDAAPVAILGPGIGRHAQFPQGVNAGFVEHVDSRHIRLRVFERGVGETRACGTGAAAAMAVGRQFGNLEENCEVSLPGGTLTVSWRGPGHDLWQNGPATTVYEGTIEL